MRLALAVLALVLLHAHEARAAVFSCDEPGVLAAIAAGGGPHTFSCPGPTTIVTSAELVISQSVELDGGGLLTLSGGGTHRVIHVDIASDAVVACATSCCATASPRIRFRSADASTRVETT